ncbi:MAG: nicotinate (nicotinamide) nucleotide adenylyltransferase [Oscillospiraceae bacterium]|nr:nicotinate (nicotinamide) nucleotide adenylyltransferase [Oscillospiraceae bacterium]
MRIGIYGGAFNPPHTGHTSSAREAVSALTLDRLLVVPSGTPPHKAMPPGSPDGAARLELARLAFGEVPRAEVSDIELACADVSYTADTVAALRIPGAEYVLICGTDMFLTVEQWKDSEKLLKSVSLAVTARRDNTLPAVTAHAARLFERYGVSTELIHNPVIDISSSELRALLPGRGGARYMDDSVYSYIIKNRLYGARADFNWLRARAHAMLKETRVPHVEGCETEAVRLAERWGADADDAREAGILHDITKRLDGEEQRALCEKYKLPLDELERQSEKLLHSKTGAASAFDEFGVPEAVRSAILWHTTGRADMSLLEKIIYMADYIEPTRDFDGVDELRRLAYADLDLALIKGLEMSISDMRGRDVVPHPVTLEALDYLQTERNKGKNL